MSAKPSFVRDDAPRSLARMTRFLAVMAGLAMATSGELEVTFLVVFLSLFLFSIRIESFPRLHAFLGFLQPFLATVFFGLGIADFFFLSNSFLLSIAHFLLCLQGLRLLALRTPRENFGSLMLSSMMILSASTLSTDWSFFLMLALFLPALIWALILLNLSSENLEAVNDEVRAAVSAGAAPDYGDLLRENSPAWRSALGPLRSASATGFLTAVFCCAFVFVTFPRYSLQGWKGQMLQPVKKSGFSNRVDLSSGGRIYDDDSVVMRVEIDREQRPLWTGYLRGAVLETFDGRVWSERPGKSERVYSNSRGEIHLPPRAGYGGPPVRQRIYLESTDSPVLFAMSRPSVFYMDRPFLLVGDDEAVKRPFGDSWRIHYDVVSHVIPPIDRDPDVLNRWRQSVSQANAADRASLALPAPMPKVETLARRVTQGAANPVEAALRISRYLSSEFTYATDASAGGAESPVEAFLFETRRGHCEYFASAMCTMLRSVGIPARMVTGFHSNEWNERGGYVVVRMRHSHSWVEAYIKPFGWIEFDPSPATPASGGGSSWFARLKQAADYLNLRWNRYILSYDLQRQLSVLRTLNERSRQLTADFDGPGATSALRRLGAWLPRFNGDDGRVADRGGSGPFFIGGVFALVSAVAGGYLVFRRRRRSAVWFYPELLRYVESRAGRKPPFETMAAFARRASPHLGDRVADVTFLTDAYYRLRFGRPAASSVETDVAQIRRTLARLKAST